jgi:hypothetical protein
VQWVEQLAECGEGVAKRLLAGARSLLNRRDGNVHAWIDAAPDMNGIKVVVCRYRTELLNISSQEGHTTRIHFEEKRHLSC